MDTFFRFVYLNVIYGGAVVLCMSLWYRIKYYKQPVYLYPITGALSKRKIFAVSYKKILSTIRFLILAGLLLLVARPQLVDQVSNVNVQGIDIMMVLDVSGSMQLFDDLQHRKSRIAVAKEEAIKFINKRESDPIGLVYFADQALTRCPVTLDKKMLESIITSTELGILNPQGTMLSKGLLMAINRLKKSDSKSKIIIVLTDGEPTPGDENPNIVIALAKKYGIKIYAIGIGGKDGGYFETPFGIQAVGMPLNTQLLSLFAQETGGKAFRAEKPDELTKIYEIINQLEKTEYETNMYQKHEDIFMPFLWFLTSCLMVELLLTQTVWFGL